MYFMNDSTRVGSGNMSQSRMMMQSLLASRTPKYLDLAQSITQILLRNMFDGEKILEKRDERLR